MQFLFLPFITFIFAYLELGGNYYAIKLLENKSPNWVILIVNTIIFSVLYSITTALFQQYTKLNMQLLMIHYGIAFSIVSMFFDIEWGKIPSLNLAIFDRGSIFLLLLLYLLMGYVLTFFILFKTR
jgi:hypothetical protein